jgi:hypothetical protein
VAFFFQLLGVGLDAAGELRVQAAVVFDDPPVGGDGLLAGLAILLGGLGDDAKEDARVKGR